MSKALEYQINPSIFGDLVEISKKLPDEAPGEHKHGGMYSYDNPAGLALLGLKDNEIDTVQNLSMSGGCWDAPNINYTDMDKGFRALLAKDRVCMGMALIRHPNWEYRRTAQPGKISRDLLNNIIQMRTAFADITKTVWVIYDCGEFKVYRVTKSKEGRILVRETSTKKLFNKDTIKDTIVEKKLKDEQDKKEKKRLSLEAAKKTKQELAEKEKHRKEQFEIDFKERKKKKLDIGNGYIYMLNKKGEYILWQTS